VLDLVAEAFNLFNRSNLVQIKLVLRHSSRA